MNYLKVVAIQITRDMLMIFILLKEIFHLLRFISFYKSSHQLVFGGSCVCVQVLRKWKFQDLQNSEFDRINWQENSLSVFTVQFSFSIRQLLSGKFISFHGHSLLLLLFHSPTVQIILLMIADGFPGPRSGDARYAIPCPCAWQFSPQGPIAQTQLNVSSQEGPARVREQTLRLQRSQKACCGFYVRQSK